MDKVATLIDASFLEKDQIEEREFSETINETLELSTFLSHEKIVSIFQDCVGKAREKRTNPEIWKRFQDHLIANVEQCDDNYCTDCYETSHAKGRRSRHEWVGYAENCAVCVECESLPAERYCTVCKDNLCCSCAKSTHQFGKKHRHAFEEIKEVLLPQENESHCVSCETRVGTETCNYCSKKACDSCSKFKHPKDCEEKVNLFGTDDNALECSVCQKQPDTMCVECGDVYCSIKWMGNPGCYRKMHNRGNRKNHTQEPYTYVSDRIAAMEHKLEEEKQLEEERKEEEAELTKESNAKMGKMRNFLGDRTKKLEEEAQNEFEEKHRERMKDKALAVKKKGFRLPSLTRMLENTKKKNLPSVSNGVLSLV